MSNYLDLAEKHRKKRDYSQAIKYYQVYEEAGDRLGVRFYRGYGRSLMRAGHINEAKKVLNRGHRKHPKSKGILRATYRLNYQQRRWDKAQENVSKLLEIEPTNSSFYFMMGNILRWRHNETGATKYYNLGLNNQTNPSFKEIKNKIQNKITKVEQVKTEYISENNGRNNYGLLSHKMDEKKYITKISKDNWLSRKETIFYKGIVKQKPTLQHVIPPFIDAQVFNKIHYLTLEMIEEDENTNLSLASVVNVSQLISAVRYTDDIIKQYPNRKFTYTIRKSPNTIGSFFTKIHTKKYNQLLFESAIKFAKERKYPKQLVNILAHIEQLIMTNSLYKWIDPVKHYSLLHGDFRQENLLIDSELNKIKVIDWSTFKFGAHFVDLARYFQSADTPYVKIREHYLFNNDLERKLSEIEQVYFLLAFILSHFISMSTENTLPKFKKFILPALIDIETIISHITKKHHVSSNFTFELIQHYFIVEEEKQIERNKKIKELEEKLKNMESSRSWKLTAPLRKFVQLFVKK